MRVLVIGGTRFIGAHAVRQLVEAGADVTVLHRGLTETALPLQVRHIRDPGAEYPILRFPAEALGPWDAVIHMVAMGEADGQAAAQTFAGRTRRLVMISSGDVYRAYGRLTGLEPGPPDPVPLDEDAPLRSVLYPYRAQAKRLGAYAQDYEKILAEQAIRARLPGAVILRLPKVYGPEDPTGLATIRAFAKQPQWRWTFGHVADVAQAIVLAATHKAAQGRTYNVGEPVTPSMGERLAGLPATEGLPPDAPPFDYRQDMVCDTRRIRAELGYAERTAEASEPAAPGGI